jgi:hypothetical protein
MQPYPLLLALIFPFLVQLVTVQIHPETLSKPHQGLGQRRRSTILLTLRLGVPIPFLEKCYQGLGLLVTYPLAGFSFVQQRQF